MTGGGNGRGPAIRAPQGQNEVLWRLAGPGDHRRPVRVRDAMARDEAIGGGIAAEAEDLPEDLRVGGVRVRLLGHGEQGGAVPGELGKSVLARSAEPGAGHRTRIPVARE